MSAPSWSRSRVPVSAELEKERKMARLPTIGVPWMFCVLELRWGAAGAKAEIVGPTGDE